MEEQSFEKRKVPSDLNISNLSGISTFDNEAYDNESSFMPANAKSDGEEYECNPENKKGKYDFDIDSGSSNNMPERYCHVRYGDRRVKNEIYSVMQEKVIWTTYMSKRHIEGSILAVANILFERDWKPYKVKGAVDSKTLPSMKNILHTTIMWSHGIMCNCWWD